jgi:MFS family permease
MNRTFYIIALVSFLNALSFTILIPTIYPYAVKFGLNDFQASLLLSIFSFAQFFATPIMGKLSDKYGRKPLLLISIFGTLISNLVAGFASVAWVLFLARLIDGMTGGNMSIIQAIVADVTDSKNRTKGYSIMGATFGAGFVLGPALAIVARKIPIPFVTELGRPFIFSAFLAFVGFVLISLLLPETLKVKSTTPLKLGQLGLEKLIPSLSKPVIGKIFLLTFFNGFAFTIFTFAFQPFFLKQLGGTFEQLALVFTIAGIISVITQLNIGRVTSRFGLIAPLITTFVIRSICLIILSFITSINIFYVAVIFFSIFNIAVPIVNSLVSLNSNPDEQGLNAGLNSSYSSLSNAMGPAAAGLMIGVNYHLPFIVAGIAILILAYEISQSHNNMITK